MHRLTLTLTIQQDTGPKASIDDLFQATGQNRVPTGFKTIHWLLDSIRLLWMWKACLKLKRQIKKVAHTLSVSLFFHNGYDFFARGEKPVSKEAEHGQPCSWPFIWETTRRQVLKPPPFLPKKHNFYVEH